MIEAPDKPAGAGGPSAADQPAERQV
jgi:hypothetical protein